MLDNISLHAILPAQNPPMEKSTLSEYPLIEVNGLTKIYKTTAREHYALNNIDLTLYQGEFLAIVGKSGAGKSTLINLLTGIDTPTSGEIYFQGQAVHDLGEDQKSRWRGKNLGVVFQFFQLLPTLNLVENITIAMDFLGTIPLGERKDRAIALLEKVGIADHAYKVPAKISGGQQQRAAIARALANDPSILIADEPTGNLDSRTATEIFDLFSLLVDEGRTVLVVTHDKGISTRASRLVQIRDGELIRL